MLGVMAAALVGVYFLLRKKQRKEKLNFMMGLSLFVLLYLLVYKAFLSQEPEADFIIWNELPLHLCNISGILAFFGAWKDRRTLQGMCFFECTIGAVLALLIPTEGFSDVPFFCARGLGYWGFHFLVLFLGLAFVVSGVFQPRFSDIPKANGLGVLIALGAHGVNLLLRATVYSEANYFYTFGLEGSAVAEKIFGLIPIPFLCVLPVSILIMAVDCILILPTRPWRKKTGK